MSKELKVCATIEARMGSQRLPGKVLLPLCGKEVLWHIYHRLSRCPSIARIIVATTTAPEDAAIVNFCEKENIPYYRGSTENIVERILKATEKHHSDIILQATGDNPFIEPRLVEEVLRPLLAKEAEYSGNHFFPLPIGLEVRAFTREALLKTSILTDDPIDLVHGSYYIYQNPSQFKIQRVMPSFPSTWVNARLTLDEPGDYALAQILYEALYPLKEDFDFDDVMNYLKEHPNLINLNHQIRQKRPEEA